MSPLHPLEGLGDRRIIASYNSRAPSPTRFACANIFWMTQLLQNDCPVSDWLGRRAQLSPERVALLDPWSPGQRQPSPELQQPQRPPLSYRQLHQAASQTARLLQSACGIASGDRVAILAKNCRAYLELLFACGQLGAILQTLNWRLSGPELAAQLQDARPLVLCVTPEYLELGRQLSQLGSVRPQLLLIDEAPATLAESPPLPTDLLRLSMRAELKPEAVQFPARSLRDPWVLCYTGGSTGAAKGALLTHGSMLWNAINTATSWGLTADDCALLNAPLFHTGGMNVFTVPLLYLGGASVLCREWRTEQVLDLLSEPPTAAAVESSSALALPAISVMFGVPTMFQDLQAHPRFATTPLERLKLVISGGAPCPPAVFQRFFERHIRFRTGYGLTEAGPNNFVLPEEVVLTKPGCVGQPMLHVEAELVDSSGAPCQRGEVGELRLRGPHLCGGYFEKPTETAQLIRDGWLYTGDLARQDSDGHFYIVGRSKEMFISGGENVYPVEVEAALTSHPQVMAACVLGIPDERWGEVGCAFVVPSSPITQAELQSHCRTRLASYKVPRSFVFVDELPRTSAGKIDRRALQTLARSR